MDSLDITVTWCPPWPGRVAPDTYDFLIITPTEFSDSLQALAEHKENHGLRTIMATLTDIYGGAYFPVVGRGDAEIVKYFIKDAIENWGITSVLLVGGRHGGIATPQWWCPVCYSHLDANDGDKKFLSDLYFADIYKYGENGEVTLGSSIYDCQIW